MRSAIILTLALASCTDQTSSGDHMYLIADISSSATFDSLTVWSLENPDAKFSLPLEAPAKTFTYDSAVQQDSFAPSLVVDARLGGKLVAHGELANIDYLPQTDGSWVAHVDLSLADPHRTTTGGEHAGDIDSEFNDSRDRTATVGTHFDDVVLPNGERTLSGGYHHDRGAF